MRILGHILWLIISGTSLLFIASFVSVNTQSISLSLWPFSTTITAEIWLVVLASICFGLLVGGLVLWFASLPLQARSWRLNKKLAKADVQIELLSEQLADTQRHPDDIATDDLAPRRLAR
jgi:hypothetical protein